ncbi:MAG TPA: glycine zipper family protein [Nitrosomonas sp.]|nr:glycine zipper family protein [Nitrosomonas sp.]HMW21783.1 glycine zipper family protein [Nitrosomonas sp.]HMW69181.1 glycine zipper family protein [Nitrosomonas sp.]HNB02127.1 glycine zipper family protein [Nitrosomonas sp.]HND37304.1 glycine zipper family protein [Nitrosomonas sp.]
MKFTTSIILGILIIGLTACSTTQPILYPNDHFLKMGKQVAERDIEACRQLAESAGAEEQGTSKVGDVATSTAMGAGMGAASGAVGGAISGSAGSGSLIGAASGATFGLIRGLFGAARPAQPNQAYVNFVSRCLHDKGYEVTGWQ